jgi:hypothetical protein
VFTSKRFAGAAALAFAAAMSFGQTALADSEHGQTGNHLFTDDSSHPGVMCKYVNTQAHPDVFWLAQFVAQPPSAWWPDQDSNKNNEHGTVGWRMTIQNDATGSYKTVKQTSYQKKTAYEDSQAQYDPSTKAPFSKIAVNINGHNYTADTTWRINVRINWYRSNGSVLGFANHTVIWYGYKLGNVNGFLPVQGSCITKTVSQ